MPDFEIPGLLQAFLILFVLFTSSYALRNKLFPVTIEDVKKMPFEKIVEYLENTPVIDRGDAVWNAAVERGIDLWSKHVDAELTGRFWRVISSQKQVIHAERFKARVSVTSLGILT